MKGYDQDEFGNILLPEVVSQGFSGEDWIPILEEKGYIFGGVGSLGLEGLSKSFFRDPNFKSTSNITYRPIVVFGKNYKNNDRSVPWIKREHLQKGYTLPPMEVFPLLCVADFMGDFLHKAECRSMQCLHDPIQVLPWRKSDTYVLSLDFYSKEDHRTIRGTYSSVNMAFYSDCMFIFLKRI